MVFGFNHSQGAMGASSTSSSGPDLESIATEDLGFLSIAGDAKLRLTSAWSPLPAPTSSLLSVASRKGLVAAAGPDQIIIATTESVRKGFEAEKDGDSDIRKFSPQLTLPMPMRVSQLSFTADENYLILSAESGGGLAVYEVQSLLSGTTKPAFELGTNGESLRVLAPNPTPEKAELCAIVTVNGNLYMANLKDRRISDPLKNQVSCVSWSSKGKQLCAGLANGTIHQMTPEGEAKAEIPQAPNMGNHHVSSLTWLENNLWLAIYTWTDASPASTYNIITRQSSASFTFQKIQDPIEPFMGEKVPHHSILRLRDFPPDLQDLLILSSTASTDVGLLSRSKKALANDKPADSITNVFTMTELLDDSKRPTLPMTDSMDDSTVVGSALDLSSKDKVYKPIPSDEELEESPSPLPGYWMLTHEGVLCSWWLIYNASIKQRMSYPGLATSDGSASALTAPTALAPSPFSKSAFGSSSATTSAFGVSAPTSTLNSASAAAPLFGSSSALGQKSSPWGAPSSPATTTPKQTGGATFGSSSFGSTPSASAPTFGKPSSLGFGQSTQLGMRSSPWASGGASTGATFGQSGFSNSTANGAKTSAFGSGVQSASQAPGTATGGFSGFANQGGFASLAANKTGGSVFGAPSQQSSSSFSPASPTAEPAFGTSSKPSSNPFGSNTITPGNNSGGSVFGASSKPLVNSFGLPAPVVDSVFGQKSDKATGTRFESESFKLQSSFKPDQTALADSEKPTAGSSSSMFGNAFESALDDAKNITASSTPAKEVDMDSERTPQVKPPLLNVFCSQTHQESTTPTSTPAPSKFTNASPAAGSSLFGQPTPSVSSGGGLFSSNQDTPKATGFSGFFNHNKDKPKVDEKEPGTPKVKLEAGDTPLPPDTTSRLAYPLGDSSSSSATSNAAANIPLDAPLPPNPSATPKPSKKATDSSSPGTPESITSDTHLPPDFVNVPRPKSSLRAAEDAPLPPDFTKQPKTVVPEAPLPSDPTPRASSKKSHLFDLPEVQVKNPFAGAKYPALEEDDSESDVNDDDSEGSGVDVSKHIGPTQPGFIPSALGSTPQSSFSALTSTTPGASFGSFASTTPGAGQTGQDSARPSFGDVSRNAPVFPRPNGISPRSPSPIREAVPRRMLRSDTRSVSAPGMASQILSSNKAQSQLRDSIVSRERQADAEDPFMTQHRKLKARQEAEETQPLVDEEDDEVQRILSSKLEGTLTLDEFIAHSNTAPPANESVPSQVEAVYRDINSMIDTVGLNSRSVKAYVKGHSEPRNFDGRPKERVEISDDWVLHEINELGRIIDEDLRDDLEGGRVQDFNVKLQACKDLSRDMQRLRAKHEDLKKIVNTRMDPKQVEATQSLPLSAEQSTQQNELRKEFTKFSKLMSEAEEALTLLKTRIASVSGSSGRGNTNMPTVEAIMRTITKMTSMVEKRSGDIDVLENRMRKVRLGSTDREASPMTPQARRSMMFSPESTPSRNLRHSFAASVGSISSPGKATPRKKLSGFSNEEKSELMDKKARRKAVLEKLKDSLEKKGVSVWTMEDIE